MILNLSADLAKKLHCKPKSISSEVAVPYLEWYGHIFYAARKPYILTIEATSIFTAIIEAKGILDPDHYASSLAIEIKDLCKIYGLQEQAYQILSSMADGIEVRKSSNRSLVAHVNEMIYHSRVYMEYRSMNQIEAAILVNEMPVKMNGMEYPIEIFGGKNVSKKAYQLSGKLRATSEY